MLTIAGGGPGNPKYLTFQVKERIEQAEILIAFGRIGDSIKPIRSDIIRVSRVAEVLDIIKANRDKDILLLASGDPNFYGITNYLKRNQVEIKEILPGLSSFQYMMAKLGEAWEEANLLSLHGREESLDSVKDYPLTICLTDKKNTPSEISRGLEELGIEGEMYVGYNLSYKDENIVNIKIGEELEDFSPLAVVVIKNEMD